MNPITLQVAGAQVSIPHSTLVDMWLDRVRGQPIVDGPPKVSVYPKIGEPLEWEGGIYAGIVRGDLGEPDYRLIVCESEQAKINWQDAKAWVAGLVVDDCRDFTLPKRKEQAVLFGNVPEMFEKDWYWSNEQYAGLAEYAWIQGFGLGTQLNGLKDYDCRARAVRRIPI